MTDFKKMAADAKAKLEHEDAERARKAAEEKDRRERVISAGRNMLQSMVMPILERAKREFATEGFDSKITERTWHQQASLAFQFVSPPRRSDQYRHEGVPAVFQSDGSSIVVGIGTSRSDAEPKRRLGTHPPGDLDGLIETSLREVLSLYTTEWERYRRSW